MYAFNHHYKWGGVLGLGRQPALLKLSTRKAFCFPPVLPDEAKREGGSGALWRAWKPVQCVDSITGLCRVPACCSNDIWTTGNQCAHSNVLKRHNCGSSRLNLMPQEPIILITKLRCMKKDTFQHKNHSVWYSSCSNKLDDQSHAFKIYIYIWNNTTRPHSWTYGIEATQFNKYSIGEIWIFQASNNLTVKAICGKNISNSPYYLHNLLQKLFLRDTFKNVG